MNDSIQIEELTSELQVVYQYLRKLGISHQDAEDVAQEAAYRFLVYRDSLKIIKVRSWLIRVALNIHYDQYRKNKRIQLGFQDDQLTMLSKDLPEDILLSNENWSEVQQTLLQLKPRYKELLLLKYQSCLKYEDISKLLQLSLGGVKMNLFRARKQFIKYYREYTSN